MKKQKGITLIALIITIIVMLILVGVTVTVAINGGLFNTAKEAARGTENAKIFEQIQLAVTSAYKATDKLPKEEFLDSMNLLKSNEKIDEAKYEKYLKFYDLVEENKFLQAYFLYIWENEDSKYSQFEQALDKEDFATAYSIYTGYNSVDDFLEDNLEISKEEITEELLDEFSKEIKEEFFDAILNEIKPILEGTGLLDFANIRDWKTNDLNRDVLLRGLNTIEGIEIIPSGTNMYYDSDGVNYYKNDWAVELRYGEVKVTILGTGEIIGPISTKKIKSVKEDEKPGDITDNNILNGSKYDPYQIKSIEDLVAFSNSVNEGNTYEGKYIELAIDLDFKDSKSYKNANSTQFGDLNEDGTVKGIQEELTDESGKGFTPIGVGNEESQKSFNGTFNGNYHKIKNTYINNSENVYLALFAKTESATIENLGLEGGKIINSNSGHPNTSSKTNYVAGIVGSDEDNGYKKATIKNCFVDLDEIKGANAPTTCIAGIALEAEKIEASYNKTNITSNYEAFGIAWSCNEVIDCYNIGNISVIGGSVFSGEGSSEIYAEGNAAGISNGRSAINCYNAGTILSQYTGENVIKDSNKQNVNAVGIIYASYGRCVSCFNLGVVIGDGDSYGITTISEGGKFTNCYNTANITSKYGVACGIASSIYDEQDAGKLMNTGKISGKTYAYGLTRYDDVLDSYYLAGQVYVDGVQKEDDEYAKTQEEMDLLMKPILEVINSTVTSNWGSIICEGNAFVEDTNNINNGLPILKWQVEH